jgi:hypothetical protein
MQRAEHYRDVAKRYLRLAAVRHRLSIRTTTYELQCSTMRWLSLKS